MMADNAYHQIPYLSNPMPLTHPNRLASVATLFGMAPAPVTACRVLELGCGSGGNLIPMAHFLPGSRFTGVDLADLAVAEGRRAIGELGLPNLDLIAMDLSDIGPALGEFDYIIANGVYSWIPDDLRDRLLAVCRERMAPQGVALISYNALPGRYVHTMLRDMMLYHTRNGGDPRERIVQARDLLGKLRDAHLASGAWQPMLDEEIRQMSNRNEGWFFHDDIAPINDSFYVRDFAARAARHSLQYLGDAQAHLMFDTRTSLDWVGGDVMEREQYFDFLSLRQFRNTLLCGSEVQLERPAGPERMDRFLFSSPARQSEGQIEGLNSVCITEAPEAVGRVAAAMGAVYPMPVAFDKLLESAGDREALRGILFTLISSGFAEFHIHDYSPSESVSPRPRASRLARWEAARTGLVTYSSHRANKLDGMLRALIEQLDGTRDFDGLVCGIALVEGAPSLAEIRARLPEVLVHMARTGLLEA
jgi:SAM-dependent methyltransferase